MRSAADGAWEELALRQRAPRTFEARVAAAYAFQVLDAAGGALLVVPEDDVVPASQVNRQRSGSRGCLCRRMHGSNQRVR